MCHSRTNNRKINRLHERCLRIVHTDKQLSFTKLLERDSSFSARKRNIQILATEMYKIRQSLSSPVMHNVFSFKNGSYYNLRRQISQFSRPLVKSADHRTESILYLDPQI